MFSIVTRAEGERVDRRQLRATLITDQADVRAQQEAQQQREIQSRMITYADAFKRITEATHVNCIEVRDRGDTCQLYRSM